MGLSIRVRQLTPARKASSGALTPSSGLCRQWQQGELLDMHAKPQDEKQHSMLKEVWSSVADCLPSMPKALSSVPSVKIKSK